MFANAAQVLDRLDDRIELRVAKDTKLIRVGDRLACLRFHSTVVAWYGERSTKLTTDWHTPTTWRRIAHFTPANPQGQNFLRFLVQPNGDRVLYQPGLIVDANGLVQNPMMPSRQRRIEAVVKELIPNIRHYARTAVEAWNAFRETDCECMDSSWWREHDEGEEMCEHILAHAKYREPILPYEWRIEASRLSNERHTTAVTEPIRKSFSEWMMTHLIPHAIWGVDPNFKFPYRRSKQL